MIQLMKEKALSIVSEYMWSVYQNEEKRTTPPYHNLEAIERHLEKIMKSHDEVLGVYVDGNLEGIALLLLDKKNAYLSVQGPYILRNDLYASYANEVFDYIKEHYSGFKCDVGTTKTNINSQNFLMKEGFICTDDTIQMSIKADQQKSLDLTYDIRALTEDRKEEYALFHDQHYKGYYWDSSKIYESMSQWKIHVLIHEDKITGSVFTRAKAGGSGEIYGCELVKNFKNKSAIAQLFYVSTQAWFKEDVKEIVNFVPEGLYSESAHMVGYRSYDTYMCFSKEQI